MPEHKAFLNLTYDVSPFGILKQAPNTAREYGASYVVFELAPSSLAWRARRRPCAEVGKALGGVLVDDDVDGHGDKLCEWGKL